MSWFSKNYEKLELAGAIVMALGVAVRGWTKSDGVNDVWCVDVVFEVTHCQRPSRFDPLSPVQN